ncbi:MAG: glycosyltransferase 87 family protein, partial [Propionibacteriaceae bacterium]|nr:glycosyltransferase 87 family protein [Propionibacteriaceae bacterium]
VPQWLGGGSEWGYTGWFVGLVLVADLGFCALIWLTAARWRGWAVVVWSVLCALLGPLVWLRFDLLPAVLAGAALLLVARRPGTAGGLLAVGAGTKLWPGLLFPLLVNRPDGIRHRDWFSASIGFGVTGVVLVIGSLVTGGWARLFSPLVWQSDRGLQIESVPATVLMGLRAVDPQAWHITVSRYQAFEIFGPGVDAWLTVSDIASLVGLALGVWILIVHWRRRYADRQTWATAATVATLAYLLLFIVTNKTLSPQYVIWLGGPIAVLIAWHGLRTHRAGLPLLRWTSLVLATAALTHVVYPILYDRVNGMADDAVGTPVATVVLVLRNLLLVVLTIDVVRHAVNPRADLPSSGRFGYARVKV